MRTDIYSGTRYIAVVSASDGVKKEWKKVDPLRSFLPIYEDYALMKVLYMLGLKAEVTAGIPTHIRRPRIPVNVFEYGEPLVPLDFSGLRDSDTIFIAGHGNDKGLYALGPDAREGTRRLAQEILTNDGNLKKKRKDKTTSILLLSCRAGLGFHKGLARNLFKELGSSVTVGGALGFTFGSMETLVMGQNEVLLEGIPWRMEYPGSIKNEDADKKTSAREGKTITYDGKKNEIKAFMDEKKKLEDEMRTIIGKLKSTEVNRALDELENRFGPDWLALIRSQFELYKRAKKASNLEFDMWYDRVTEGYVWTNGKMTTDPEADSLLDGALIPVGDGLTSTK